MKKLLLPMLIFGCTALIATDDAPLSDKDAMTSRNQSEVQELKTTTIEKTDVFIACGNFILREEDTKAEHNWGLFKDKNDGYKFTIFDGRTWVVVSVEMENDAIARIKINADEFLDLKQHEAISKGEVNAYVYQKADCAYMIPILIANWEAETDWLRKEHRERREEQDARWQEKHKKLKAEIKRDDEHLKSIIDDHHKHLASFIERKNQK